MRPTIIPIATRITRIPNMNYVFSIFLKESLAWQAKVRLKLSKCQGHGNRKVLNMFHNVLWCSYINGMAKAESFTIVFVLCTFAKTQRIVKTWERIKLMLYSITIALPPPPPLSPPSKVFPVYVSAYSFVAYSYSPFKSLLLTYSHPQSSHIISTHPTWFRLFKSNRSAVFRFSARFTPIMIKFMGVTC